MRMRRGVNWSDTYCSDAIGGAFDGNKWNSFLSLVKGNRKHALAVPKQLK